MPDHLEKIKNTNHKKNLDMKKSLLQGKSNNEI